MENLGHGRKKVIEELLRGREVATQLRHILNEGCDNNGSTAAAAATTTTTKTPFAKELVKEVLMTFTNSLLFLNNSSSESHEVSDLQLRDTSKSEDSLESNCKSSIVKERRGCYKRRKISQTWEKESEIPVEDGHQWREYGQKVILNAKYPRSYYRCTHKYDQHCRATKQVQRIQEDPPLYKTTYYGHHTCKNLQNPDIIVDSVSPSGSSMFLSFDNSFPTPTKQDCPLLSSSFPSSSSVKRECKEEISPPPSSSPNDNYPISSELTFFFFRAHFSSELTFDDSQKHASLSSTLDVIPAALYYSAEFDDDVLESFLEIR